MNDWTPLMTAALAGNLQEIQTLVTEGADVNARDKQGWTPLMIAASGGHTQIVEFLINHGADLHAQAQGGQTALILAQNNARIETMDFLRARLSQPRVTSWQDIKNSL